MSDYQYIPFEYVIAPELCGDPVIPSPVVIIGAGPVGLSVAIDLAIRGIPSTVLDDNNVVSVGSRAICWSKRTLEIFDRLGVGGKMLDKGVGWQIGRVFHGDREIFAFELQPEKGDTYPAFVNLQQYYVEQYLIERAKDFPELISLRFKNKVTSHEDKGNGVSVNVETPDGNYTLTADYLIACDGAGSDTRRRMGLSFEGQSFNENFLIIDVNIPESPFPNPNISERWFWFEPSFHKGQSALFHKQPDQIYRIDLQLGFDADPELEIRDENITPRIKAILGKKSFQIDWVSVYRFRCAMLENFVHNRVIFAGDSAHVVSPFGARGGNGGIQDADNLCWKLALILKNEAPEKLLDTYNEERVHGARVNLLNSSRTTNFMTPKSPVEFLFRKEILRMSKDLPFARRLINSGRMSVPCSLNGLRLQTQSAGSIEPGMALIDVPLRNKNGDTCLLREVPGQFTLVGFGNFELPDIKGVQNIGIAQTGKLYPCFEDHTGLGLKRYSADCGYLFRPDQHVCAVFEKSDKSKILDALKRAKGNYL